MQNKEITKAIRKLGERSRNIEIANKGGIAVVYVNHEYFGVYDFLRHKFVD